MDPAAIVMIVVAGTVGVFSVPLVWMLTSHQRKMALIIHGSQQGQNAANNDAMTSEIRELKQMVYQQAIALDSLTSEVRRALPPPATPDSISNRLNEDRIRT